MAYGICVNHDADVTFGVGQKGSREMLGAANTYLSVSKSIDIPAEQTEKQLQSKSMK